MRLLLDTHTFLWHAEGSSRISAKATSLLVDSANELLLSMASVWEIAIKVNVKKLALKSGFSAYIAKAIATYNISVLPIDFDDCVEYVSLPIPLPQHRDPFDRMIIVHAQRHSLDVVGTDPNFDAYGITRLW